MSNCCRLFTRKLHHILLNFLSAGENSFESVYRDRWRTEFWESVTFVYTELNWERRKIFWSWWRNARTLLKKEI